MLQALIVDDEASARADLREKLRLLPDIAVVGEAATLLTARALLSSADYNVVFLDVQLIGGISFDLVPFVRPGASIVFATAHERYAARAFESHAVDYLLKPIDSGRLAEALRRVAIVRSSDAPAPRDNTASDSVCTATAASARPGPAQADGATTEITLTRDERDFLRRMIEAWEDSLRPTHPLRMKRGDVRTVLYQRDAEPTRLFLAHAPVSMIRRWWRPFRA